MQFKPILWRQRTGWRHRGCLRCLVFLCPALLAAFLLCCLSSLPALGLIKFDFEQKYYVHPGHQVWDFCLVRHEGLYHIFYHSVPNGSSSPPIREVNHATSTNFIQWNQEDPALYASSDYWEEREVWAPDVVWDPASQRWAMFYTGVDMLRVQRICLAWSTDLYNFTQDPANPVVVPDSTVYFWSPTTEWSDFRDPFVYFENGRWNLHTTAALRVGGYPGYPHGILQRSVSNDLVNWWDAGVFWLNNGDHPSHVMESSQYHQRGFWYHLYFGEYDVQGISHVSTQTVGGWDMSDRELIDWGAAAEIDQFDPGVDIFSRMAPLLDPQSGLLTYVVRFDTLTYDDGGRTPVVLKPHPLDAAWASREGASTLGNPTFGDNPLLRGEESCGLVGNGWFGSQEYFMGPLSGYGSPGTKLGDVATGRLTSHPFILEGDFINMRVGGGYYPETCYIALVDAETDTILVRETGNNSETMTFRRMFTRPFIGRLVNLQIVDLEEGNFGHINVDEIEEVIDPLGAVPAPVSSLLGPHGCRPNPCNPATRIHFSLTGSSRVQVQIHDLRGRIVWHSSEAEFPPGPHAVSWRGCDRDGQGVSAGTYLYSILLAGQRAGSGKIALVK